MHSKHALPIAGAPVEQSLRRQDGPKRTVVFAGFTVLLTALSACSGGEGASGEDPDSDWMSTERASAMDGDETVGQVEVEYVEDPGTLVAELQPNDQQTIQVYEYADGSTFVFEKVGADFDASATPSLAHRAPETSLADFLEQLAPDGLDGEVLARVRKLNTEAIEAGQLGTDIEEAAELSADELDEVELGLQNGVSFKQGSCLQDGLFYSRFSSGWAGANCVDESGFPNIICRTDDPGINTGWKRARRMSAVVHNMSQCNEALFTFETKKKSNWGFTVTVTRHLTHVMGPGEGAFGERTTSNTKTDMRAEIAHRSGPEQAHLNLAANRRQ